MLTIPEAVKALFKTDGTWKNFRVHFPNGEFSDITNSQVVQESVRFTESVCSQQVLRFGMTEASMIEFETVGVGNMYGMLIECGIEIDTTSLSAAQISAIQADPGDGVLVTAADSDVGRGFYRIPYGTFRVTSCPRNQGAMTHRRVQAYSLWGGNVLMPSPFEEAKMALFLPGSTYTPDGALLSLAAMGYRTPGFLDGLGFTKTQKPTHIIGQIYFNKRYAATLKTAGGAEKSVVFTVAYEVTGSSGADHLKMRQLHSIELHGVDYGSAISAGKTVLEAAGIDPAQSGFTGWDSLMAAVLELDGASYIYPALRYSGTASKGGTLYVLGELGAVDFTEDNYAFYPLRNWDDTGGLAADITLPRSITVRIDSGSSTTLLSAQAASVYEYSRTDPGYQLLLNAAPVAEQKQTILGIKLKFYSFADSFALYDLINGFLEVSGLFSRPSRSGGCDTIELDNSAPAEIGPADMPEFWWDEYDVSPVGVVRYAYGEGADRQEVDLVIGPGGSVYDLTSNYLLQAMTGATQQDIEAALQAGMIPQLAKVTYTPVELTMRSWPWIQAGDALELTAEDGTVVDTYAMTRTIEGIQLLMDAIESKGGELMED